jgi:hypothetical protein
MREGRPAVTEWLHTTSAAVRVTRSRLAAFCAAHPDVQVIPGPGFWGADYQSADGRIAFKARYELPDLLDSLERELG